MPQDLIDAFISRTRFNTDGLVPAIAQQWDGHEVLMMAWMDEPALRETLTTGRGVYFSRSRGARWAKGDTSGHVQIVREARLDCDGDTVLLLVDQTGAACHTGTRTCFDADAITVSAGRP
jgi:phosphoribosyl-AMP cyclohydrolase